MFCGASFVWDVFFSAGRQRRQRHVELAEWLELGAVQGGTGGVGHMGHGVGDDPVAFFMRVFLVLT